MNYVLGNYKWEENLRYGHEKLGVWDAPGVKQLKCKICFPVTGKWLIVLLT
jgi:hypothetical protein